MKVREGIYYSDVQNRFYLVQKTTKETVWVMFADDNQFVFFRVFKQSNIPKNYLYLGKL